MHQFWCGSAKKLIGNCVAVAVFISEGEVWTEDDKTATLENLDMALHWIKEQTTEYDIEVHFETYCVNPEEDIVLDHIPQIDDGGDVKEEAIKQIAEQLEYESITEFYDSIKSEYEGYNIHFLFLNHNSEGRCHMYSVPIDHADRNLEYNMLYRYEGGIPSTFILAHETLHAYSAMDLYDVYGTKAGARAMRNAEKRFPHEVMLAPFDDLEQSELSEVTAFLVGWHNDPEDWYPTVIQPHDEDGFASFLKSHGHFDENGEIIIENEEELARYKFEGGEIVRYQINEQEDLIHWKIEDSDDESEYWEDSMDDNFYYLHDKNSPDKISIPINSGTAFSANTSDEYEAWTEMELV